MCSCEKNFINFILEKIKLMFMLQLNSNNTYLTIGIIVLIYFFGLRIIPLLHTISIIFNVRALKSPVQNKLCIELMTQIRSRDENFKKVQPDSKNLGFLSIKRLSIRSFILFYYFIRNHDHDFDLE